LTHPTSAQRWLNKGRPADAEDAARSVLDNVPDHPGALSVMISIVLTRQGLALGILLRGCSIGPGDWQSVVAAVRDAMAAWHINRNSAASTRSAMSSRSRFSLAARYSAEFPRLEHAHADWKRH